VIITERREAVTRRTSLGVALPSYRLYRLDGAGKIISADWLEAETDEDALVQAQDLSGGRQFELWDRDRLISRSVDGPTANRLRART
jgi:hypothetical protein